MSSIPSVLSESYDDVLAAVQDSSRGRWFLEEYASRLRTAETRSILDAIHKLEGVVTDMPASSSSIGDIEKIREAFDKARKQIASFSGEGKKLSEEGQLFSHLADKARNAFKSGSNEPEVTRGIETALRIVQNIENEIRGVRPPIAGEYQQTTEAPKPEVATEVPKPPADTQKYFQQDADMFAPPSAVLNKTVSGVADKVVTDENAQKGAKLKVFKIDAKEGPVPDLEATSAASAQGGHTPATESSAAEAKPRITIIRRKPEELQKVPLVEQTQSENAA